MHILSSYIYPSMMVSLINIAVENRLKWMVTLIETAVKNRLKWIVIVLLYHQLIFMFLHFVWLNSQCSPFLLSQCSCYMPPASLQWSWGCMPPPPPFNSCEVHASSASLQCFWCMPPAYLKCFWEFMPPSPHSTFKALDACLPPFFHFDSETCLTTCWKSHFLLIQFWIWMRYSNLVLSMLIS